MMRRASIGVVLLLSTVSAPAGARPIGECGPIVVEHLALARCRSAELELCLGFGLLHRRADGATWHALHSEGPLVGQIEAELGSCAPLAYSALESSLRRLHDSGEELEATAAIDACRKDIRRVQHYRLARGVSLTPAVELRLAALAARFRAETRQRLYVTSGTRDPPSQARAMFVKLLLGDRLRRYRKRAAARELYRAYRAARRSRRARAGIIAAMTRAIERQICRGVFISEHLRAGAVDVRSRLMRASQKRAFLRAVASFGGAVEVLEERRPPHFHLAFKHAGADVRPAFCPSPPRPDPITGLCQSFALE